MTVTQLVKQADKLSGRDRQRLLRALASVPQTPNGEKARQEKALRDFIALAGIAHSRVPDVSSDKYKHLGYVKSRR